MAKTFEENCYRTPEMPCPKCGKELSASTSLDGREGPKEGDFSICIYCATVLKFTPSISLVPVPEEELTKLPAEVLAQILKAQIAIKFLQNHFD